MATSAEVAQRVEEEKKRRLDEIKYRDAFDAERERFEQERKKLERERFEQERKERERLEKARLDGARAGTEQPAILPQHQQAAAAAATGQAEHAQPVATPTDQSNKPWCSIL